MAADGHDMQFGTLTRAQADHFVEHGYVVIPECLDPELARRWTERACRRIGYDPGDPATWREEIVWMDRHTTAPVREISPRGWGALCDVVGGEERIDPRVYEIESRHFTTIDSFAWSDAFIVNFRRGADQGWQAPSAAVHGWHKDGSYFRHFLDSREQALLVVLLWSDVAPRGGGTFIAPDSVPVVARYLAQRPRGAGPGEFGDLVHECREFMELTGPCGTLAILHPFMLHASSHNHSGRPRFMSTPRSCCVSRCGCSAPIPAPTLSWSGRPFTPSASTTTTSVPLRRASPAGRCCNPGSARRR